MNLPPTGNSESTRPANNNYFPALDGLRSLAFLMVFSDHYLLLPWGWAGVDLFFVLSGFLITGILFDTRDEPHRMRNFYIRRTLRIFPLYYGVMLLLIVSYPIFHWKWDWSWLLWPAYLGNFALYLQQYAPGSAWARMALGQLTSATHPHLLLYFGHLWSLCVEEQFYLVWPLVVFWIRDRRRLILACAAVVLVCPLLRILGAHTLPAFMVRGEALYRATPFRVDALLLGGLIALVYRGPYASAMRITARVVLTILTSALAIVLAVYPSTRHDPIGYVYPAWRFTWGLVLIDLFSACLIVLALEYGSFVFRIFSVRPMRWLGRITYGTYVFHDVLHDLIGGKLEGHFAHHRLSVAAVLLALTIALAWASFRWFETPFIQQKERWTRG